MSMHAAERGAGRGCTDHIRKHKTQLPQVQDRTAQNYSLLPEGPDVGLCVGPAGGCSLIWLDIALLHISCRNAGCGVHGAALGGWDVVQVLWKGPEVLGRRPNAPTGPWARPPALNADCCCEAQRHQQRHQGG
jgi:hypothetical protein